MPAERACFDALRRGFAALIPPNSLDTCPQMPFAEFHGFLLHSVLLDPHLRAYPPSGEYQCSFWKWAIERLESSIADEEDEVDSRIYDHYLSLLAHSSHGSLDRPSQSYVTHYWRTTLTDKIQTTTIFESRMLIENGTTGLRSWKASLVLAQFLIQHPELVIGKRVLELGAGTGFLGIIVATLQLLSDDTIGGMMYMTDVNELVLQRCRQNANLPCNISASHPRLGFHHLDWFHALDITRSASLEEFIEQEVKPELILCSDVVYDSSLMSPLVAVLELALKNRVGNSKRKFAFLAITVRNEDTVQRFLDAAQLLLHVESVNLPDSGEFLEMLERTEQVRIFRMSEKRSSDAGRDAIATF